MSNVILLDAFPVDFLLCEKTLSFNNKKNKQKQTSKKERKKIGTKFTRLNYI
jgi:hypothetical protein